MLSRLVRLQVMLPRFWVASTKPEAALDRGQGWEPWQGRGWALAPEGTACGAALRLAGFPREPSEMTGRQRSEIRANEGDRGPEAGVYCLEGH
jgi:hypothetical protein